MVACRMMRQVVVIAGPAGSGKDSVIKSIVAQHPNATFAINATTRPPRPGEEHGKSYYFLSNEEFLGEVKNGNIPEHYYRPETDTYYGLYKPDLDKQIKEGKIVFFQIQIVGAKYLKAHFNAVTFFVMPTSFEELERRVRVRAAMSDIEWQERLSHTKREIEEDAQWYDYRIQNEDGKLEEAADAVVEILKKEGYTIA